MPTGIATTLSSEHGNLRQHPAARSFAIPLRSLGVTRKASLRRTSPNGRPDERGEARHVVLLDDDCAAEAASDLLEHPEGQNVERNEVREEYPRQLARSASRR